MSLLTSIYGRLRSLQDQNGVPDTGSLLHWNSSTARAEWGRTFTGAMTFSSTTAHTGASTFASTANITGAVTLGSTLFVTGATEFFGTTLHTGAATFASTASFAGTITGAAANFTTGSFSGAMTLGSTLAVTGASTFTGAMTLSAGSVNLGVGTAVTDANKIRVPRGTAALPVITAHTGTSYGLYFIASGVGLSGNGGVAKVECGAVTTTITGGISAAAGNFLFGPLLFAETGGGTYDLVIGNATDTLAFYGGLGVAQQSVAAAATDLATVITLANSLRTNLRNLAMFS